MVKKLKLLFLTFCLIFTLCVWTLFSREYSSKSIVIGAKNCTEQLLLSEMLAQLVEKYTDIKVIRRFNLEGTSICFHALKSGNIDLYCEYTGSALLEILKETISDSYPLIQEMFLKRFDLVWLDPLGFNNTYALVTRADSPLNTLSDLLQESSFKTAFDPEFVTRPEYKILKLHQSLQMDQMLLRLSLLNRSVDVISASSTDSFLISDSLKVLRDDKNYFPTYLAAPVIHRKTLQKFPELKIVLNLLRGTISESKMRKLNYQVEIQGKSAKKVAAKFLKDLK